MAWRGQFGDEDDSVKLGIVEARMAEIEAAMHGDPGGRGVQAAWTAFQDRVVAARVYRPLPPEMMC